MEFAENQSEQESDLDQTINNYLNHAEAAPRKLMNNF